MAPADNQGGGGALVPFTREDLEVVSGDFAAYADADDGALEAARRAVELGMFTPQEAGKNWGLTAEEVAEISKPKARSRQPTALQAIDAELEKFRALRKSDRRRYWSPEVQKREAELHEARELVAAGVSVGQYSPELLAEWRQMYGGVDAAIERGRANVEAALEDLDDGERDDLEARFEALPDVARHEITKLFAIDPAGWRSADDAYVQRLAGADPALADLVQEWGPDAKRMVGRAKGRGTFLLQRLDKADRDEMLAWFDDLPGRLAAAVVRGLAGRRETSRA